MPPRAHHLSAGAVLCVSGSLLAPSVAAQGDAAARPAIGWPVLSLGRSIMEFDRGDDRAFHGFAARAGVAILSIADVGIAAQYWPDLLALRGHSVQLEVALYPVGRPRLAPYLFLGSGRFAAVRTPGSERSAFAGAATSLGLGVHGRVVGAWGVRLEGAVRFDARSLDDELRVLVTYAPSPRDASSGLPRPTVTPEVSWMAPLTGPWRSVEPGYGITLDRPVSATTGVTAGMTLWHWHIPLPGGGSRWDSRAVLVRAGARRVWERRGRLSLEAGPLASVMLEGPDAGVRGGAHAGTRTFVPAGPVRVAAGVEAMWLVRGAGRAETSTADQRAIVLRAGVVF